MSSFAFSHQFSQRWLATPSPIKQTIIQELDDITTLLQPETDLESYRFSVPNLHDKVEQLMAIEAIRHEKILAEARKREREEQERLEQQRLEREQLEQERLAQEKRQAEQQERERLEQEHLLQQELAQQKENERLEQERLRNEQLENEHLENERLAQLAQAQMSNETSNEVLKKSSKKKANVKNPPIEVTEILVKTPIEPVVEIKNEVENLAILQPNSNEANIDIDTVKQQIIQDLQQQLEGYLSGIKADISAWLEDEVTKQLTAKFHVKSDDSSSIEP